MLQRGMTADAFDEYLQGQDNVAALAGKLEAGVDGDLLLDTIKQIIWQGRRARAQALLL